MIGSKQISASHKAQRDEEHMSRATRSAASHMRWS